MTMWKITCVPTGIITFKEDDVKPVLCPHCGTSNVEVVPEV
jgi:hypothetical protein